MKIFKWQTQLISNQSQWSCNVKHSHFIPTLFPFKIIFLTIIKNSKVKNNWNYSKYYNQSSMNKNVAKHFIILSQFLWSFYMIWEGPTNFLEFFLKCLNTSKKLEKSYCFKTQIRVTEKGRGFCANMPSSPSPLAPTKKTVEHLLPPRCTPPFWPPWPRAWPARLHVHHLCTRRSHSSTAATGDRPLSPDAAAEEHGLAAQIGPLSLHPDTCPSAPSF